MFKVKFRRRKSALTNYRKRLGMVKGDLDRVVVRKTNSRIIGQLIGYSEKGDVVKASVDSGKLKKFGWSARANRSTAYLTGMLLADAAKKLGNKECILDIGLNASVKGSIPFVFAKGCVDNGLKLKGTFEVEQKLYDGSQTAKYAAEKHQPAQFSAYAKENVKVAELPHLFNKVAGEIKSKK